jgi:hypothetical protein
MINKAQIDSWIQMYKTSDNCDNEYFVPAIGRSFLKRDLVEAKCQVDRWSAVTNTWIFHSSKRDLIESLFPIEKKLDSKEIRESLEVVLKEAASSDKIKAELGDFTNFINRITDMLVSGVDATINNEPYRIWGADVHFTNDIDVNTGIGVALKKCGETLLMANDSGNIANSIIVFNIPD